MILYYKLDEDKNPVPCNAIEFAEMFNNPGERVLEQVDINGITVSTVFLGLDHRFSDDGPPILFETMIFGGEHDQYQERYCTWDEAMEGHKRALRLITNQYE